MKVQNLQRALSNLIDNSLHYGQKVEISGILNPVNYIIDIRDYGNGIPHDKLSKVVLPFYRLESSRNSNTSGTGLGLTIAKSLLEQNNAELPISNLKDGLLVCIILAIK